MNNITVAKGVATNFTTTLMRNGAPLDLTGADVDFAAVDGSEALVIAKEVGFGITIVDALLGQISVHFDGADTANLADGALLYWTLTTNTGLGPERADEGTLYVAVDVSPNFYISLEEVRALGFADPPFTDAMILEAIKTWQQAIERITRQWFYPKKLELVVDGNDSDSLFFGVPIISIAEVRLNGDTTALDKQYWKSYSILDSESHRQDPRVQLIDTRFYETDIYTAPMRDGRMLFRHGKKNQYVRGVFGCVERDGSCPALIKRALAKLVVEKLAKPLYVAPVGAPEPPPLLSGVIVEEWTDGHKIKYAQSGGETAPRAPGLSGLTNDPEILRILTLYRAPLGLATPANPSFR